MDFGGAMVHLKNGFSGLYSHCKYNLIDHAILL